MTLTVNSKPGTSHKVRSELTPHSHTQRCTCGWWCRSLLNDQDGADRKREAHLAWAAGDAMPHPTEKPESLLHRPEQWRKPVKHAVQSIHTYKRSYANCCALACGWAADGSWAEVTAATLAHLTLNEPAARTNDNIVNPAWAEQVPLGFSPKPSK